MTPRQTSPEDQRARRKLAQDDVTRQYIRDAAAEVFARKGYTRATMKEVAEEAGYSVRGLYNFFSSKGDLLRDIIDHNGAALLAKLQHVVEGDISARKKLHALADAYLDFYSEHQAFYRVVLRAGGPSWWSVRTRVDESSADRFQRAIDLETDVFEQGMADGDLRGGDPSTLAMVFLGIMQGYLARWFSLDEDHAVNVSVPEARDDVHQLLDRAFVPDAG